MDERTLRVLEFEKITQMLASQAASSLGKALSVALEPSDDFAVVKTELGLTSEARRLLENLGAAPLGGLRDLSQALGRARVGQTLDPADLLQVSDLLRCAERLQDYLVEGEEVAPSLAELGHNITARGDLRAEIERCIDDNGSVRRTASAALDRLNSQADVLERRVRERIEAILRREAERGVLQEPVIVQRSGRFCLPVAANQATRFKGLMHDRSDSGATVFMEPLEVVEIGNDLRGVLLDIGTEIERILRELSGQVGEAAPGLTANLEIMGQVDFLFARGKLSRMLDGVEPEVIKEPMLRLTGAKHPILVAARKAATGTPGVRTSETKPLHDVVPVDVWLGDEFDTLVITGPNTGGKTVTLKTVGLLSLMAQSGLHIPVDPGSKVSVWRYVWADIGDEQSIEQSLSTFSSHMTQIVRIVNRVDAWKRNNIRRERKNATMRALILLDELGAGTDPTEGAALARAILGVFHEAGCRTIATTHYNDLKVFAYATEGVENASVEFDVKTLQPTFRLRIGQAGSSNAFDIAQRLGLARAITGRAREHLGAAEKEFSAVMTQVERQQRDLNRQTVEAIHAQRELDKIKGRYEKDIAKLEGERRQALEAGFSEADEIVRQAEEEARRIIADLQRQTKQSRVTEDRRQELSELRQKVKEEKVKATPPVVSSEPTEEVHILGQLLKGDPVHVPVLGRDGTIVGFPRDDFAEVQVGPMRIEVAVSDLRAPKEQVGASAAALADKMQTRKAFSIPKELDIRGMTVDEAILELDKYLDDVAMARFPAVRIIHGKGTGQLRKGVHDFLKNHPRVRQFHTAAFSEGGDGATEVLL